MPDSALIAKVAEPAEDQATSQSRLSRADWLSAAIELLIDEGIDAVRITRLADNLSVSRGSFYWHFKDRDDLLAGLMGFWREKNTAAVVKAVEGAPSLEEGILALFDAWTDPEHFDPRLDLAVRDWARRSEDVRAALEQADADRVRAIARLYSQFGFEGTAAFIRARVIYFAQVGYYALGIEEPMTERVGYLEAYYESFTGRQIDGATADAYRKRHLEGGFEEK